MADERVLYIVQVEFDVPVIATSVGEAEKIAQSAARKELEILDPNMVSCFARTSGPKLPEDLVGCLPHGDNDQETCDQWAAKQ